MEMEGEREKERENNGASSATCCVVGLDSTTNISYIACSSCEKPLHTQHNPSSTPALCCSFCKSSSFKRFYRVVMSVASGNKVMVVICFDKAARVMFGCSADEFFDFAKVNPFAGRCQSHGLISRGHRMGSLINSPRMVQQPMTLLRAFPLQP
ncbi:uncharacterized protein LOC18426486 isoform X2 [Amborella trichopoda]|uniref:uncharacterized protein LOC18426486 isoform X2 n=1 Tax=Amborella trichopoda TaxID=13333 RepID=UPI0009BDE80B|nr:uncharacterized protein LOC18426486 isoform X2 [Amborella trichopoda]|eukprot:XP_020518117.1 uncharacterized protein LOC18426486 isoform X2 [Amborella trichopoda]